MPPKWSLSLTQIEASGKCSPCPAPFEEKRRMKTAGRQTVLHPFPMERKDSGSQDCPGSGACELHSGSSSVQSDQELQVDGTGSRVGRRGTQWKGHSEAEPWGLNKAARAPGPCGSVGSPGSSPVMGGYWPGRGLRTVPCLPWSAEV